MNPFVLHKDDFNLHDEIIKACKHTGFQPHIVFETSQRDLMLQTVSADLAIALLPSRLCPEVGENTEVGSKVVVRPLVPEIIHTLYMLFGKRSLPLPRFSLVVRLCKFQITITWITTRGSSIMNRTIWARI